MNKLNYYECEPESLLITKEDDILRIFEKSYPKRKLLIYQANLAPEFFDLSTGLAGSVLQKLVNYRVKTAFVINLTTIKSQKFREMVNEANMGDEFAFYSTKDEALQWLLQSE